MIKKFMMIFLFSFLSLAHAATIEQKISSYVIQHQDEQLSLLEQLVNINSVSTNIEGVYKVGEILRTQFEKIGFQTRWIKKPKFMQRGDTLIAEYQGKKSTTKIVLIGHLDTVFAKENKFQTFKRQGNKATGPGIIDDKGGDVVILYALKALAAENLLDNLTITVVLTGDEEDSGKPRAVSKQPLFDAAKQADIALDFEWAVTSHTATVARRGITNWSLITQGKESHSSTIFQPATGDGAIFELARILNEMRVQLKNEKYLSFNPGLILGGTTVQNDDTNSNGIAFGKTNVVAQKAFAKGDLRFLSEQQKEKAEKIITSIVNQHLEKTASSIKFRDAIPSMSPTANNSFLLKKYSNASQKLGYGSVTALDPGLRGAADISQIANLVPANLAGLGVVGTGAHTANELLDIDSLVMQTKRAALLIYWLGNEKK